MVAWGSETPLIIQQVQTAQAIADKLKEETISTSMNFFQTIKRQVQIQSSQLPDFGSTNLTFEKYISAVQRN